ncbi:hypothetical protein SAMN05216259_108293 [Actinacidiphila guanduensis]|uniref:Uncharacterized protein n=1 Tax=Actinacidiphila guanduensis TaxID=310781 RepID=A0A1H0I158_9ACTN|nr:hypothetical protein SAMN05216259_108293 [Actinacidiphila guanduensis]
MCVPLAKVPVMWGAPVWNAVVETLGRGNREGNEMK